MKVLVLIKWLHEVVGRSVPFSQLNVPNSRGTVLFHYKITAINLYAGAWFLCLNQK